MPPFLHLLKLFAFLYAYYMPGSEKAPHPKSSFRVGRSKFFVFLAKKVIFQWKLLLPAKAQAVLPFSLSTAASSRLTTKQTLKKYSVKL